MPVFKGKAGAYGRKLPSKSRYSSSAPSALVNQRRGKKKSDSVEVVIADISIAARTKNVVQFVGNQTQVAALLGVHRGQPGRWLTGAEHPSAENARLVVDVDHVVARASLIWPRDVALAWMEGTNSYLDGARPIDVLKTRGSSEVIAALDSAMAGNFS